jgi:transcriptional regulator with XRE-family HTH domain
MKESIREARIRCGLTQAELAERLNVTQGLVSHWEQGITMPPTRQIPELAKVLKTTVAELFGEAG